MSSDAPDAPADRSNWRDPPHSRWAFQHIAQVLPTVRVGADPAQTDPIGPRSLPAAPSGAAALDGFSLRLPGGATLDLDTFLKATGSDAFVVLHHGAVVCERYAHGMTAATPHILMSMTKAVTGLLAGVLAGDGAIDLEAPLAELMPELAASAYGTATLRQLLDMRAGVRPDAEQSQAYEAAISQAGAPSLRQLIPTLSAAGPHGGPFSYVSPNTDLVGWALERATGRRLADLLSERLWRPMGAEHDADMVVDGDGLAWCAGGLCATARDMARLALLVAEGGARDGRSVVPKAWIDDLYDGGDRQAWADGEWGRAFAGVGKNMSSRAGWYAVPEAPPGGFTGLFAMGTHGQNLFIDREKDVVIAKLSSQGPRIDGQAIGLQHYAAAEVVRRLAG
jgi:hypothetical protein